MTATTTIDTTTPTKPSISTWSFVWKLVKLYPWPYIGYTVAWGAFSMLELVPGLLQQRIFDRLTGDATITWGMWTLLAMISVVEVTRVVARYWTLRSDMAFQEPLRALLQRNLMDSVYRQPAAQPLPIGAGESVSRFGDDVAEVKDFPVWLPDMFGKFLFALGAVIIMARISVPMTLVAVLPGLASLWLAKFAWSRMLRDHANLASQRLASPGN
ncbi:MAG TPA: hypothetical protein P5121_23675, partial [Caldilineaceae bacterium]|nr:hypothetical protein [Caldilineaceae bacterium]